jgi:hypothetical protein
MSTPGEAVRHAGGGCLWRRPPGLYARIDHAQLAEDCRALKREKAAGPNGGRNEHHHQLFGSTVPTGPREERALKDLAFFGECYLNALLPPWCYRLSAAARPVAPLKAECAAGETPQVRPVAVGLEQWAVSRGGSSVRQPLSKLPLHFAAWLGPHQVAVGVSASAEKLALASGRYSKTARTSQSGNWTSRTPSTSSPEPF